MKYGDGLTFHPRVEPLEGRVVLTRLRGVNPFFLVRPVSLAFQQSLGTAATTASPAPAPASPSLPPSVAASLATQPVTGFPGTFFGPPINHQPGLTARAPDPLNFSSQTTVLLAGRSDPGLFIPGIRRVGPVVVQPAPAPAPGGVILTPEGTFVLDGFGPL
jgi:hypothetical protein